MLLLLCVAIAGCIPDQNKEVARYRDEIQRRFPTSAPAELGTRVSLLDALASANQHNETLGISGENYLQALIAKDRAIGAFLPRVGISPVYSFQQKVSSNVPGANNGNTSFDITATASGNAFNGFRDVASLNRAEAGITQTRELLYEAQESVLVNVAQVYYQVLRSELSAAVLETSVNLQQERLRNTQARQRAGLAKPLDVAQAEAQLRATEVALLQAKSDVLQSRELLSFVIGRAVGARRLSDEFGVPRSLPDPAQLAAQAGISRHDLQAAVANIEAARQNLLNAIGQYYPSVGINFNYFLRREHGGIDWAGAITANLPIFSAFEIESDVRTAWSVYRQATMNEQQLRRQVAQQVAIAYEQFRNSSSQLDALALQLRAADQALRLAYSSFLAGTATNLDVQASLDARQNAALQLASERYNHKVVYLNVLRSVGNLTETVVSHGATTAPATIGQEEASSDLLMPPVPITNPAPRGPSTRP